ncbi:hypothetical protein FOPG_18891 [Fusarium oxysporum f. sp. conglutinans race 2 54008]|uniref:Uncharacterized protein n=1 Tax=Fusarium oxysporum f. sp. conglutinans race 2 54008 TaxID=1089457 RepID=X0HUN8_FUSOX|nr:hypothetical protein FOPG_18891 [Fusarium oxysporum f. sp. conglutinans race 2 54008]
MDAQEGTPPHDSASWFKVRKDSGTFKYYGHL